MQYSFVLGYPAAYVIRQGRSLAFNFWSTKLSISYNPAYSRSAMPLGLE